MFKCEKCNRQTQPNEKQLKHTVEVRRIEGKFKDKKTKSIKDHRFEIVKEINICERCARNIKLSGVINE